MSLDSPIQAQYLWLDAEGAGRNVFALFRRVIQLDAVPTAAVLHLFADTRYRMRVNGEVVASGPARFYPTHPEFDSIDLKPFLRPGINVITVGVNTRGANSYQAAPSRGGFIAWGAVQDGKRTHDLATPGDWRMRPLDAWSSDAPTFSFAQAATEIVDLRRLPLSLFTEPADAGWNAPVIVPESSRFWGPLSPRSVPMPSGRRLNAARCLLRAPLHSAEDRFGFHRYFRSYRPGVSNLRFGYATCIFAPKAMKTTLGLFWGPHYLNGSEIKPVRHPLFGNREDYAVELKKGWNVLYGEPEVLSSSWGVLLSWARGLGLKIARLPDATEGAPFLCSRAYQQEELIRRRGPVPATPADLVAHAELLQNLDTFEWTAFPAREFACDEPQPGHPACDPAAVARVDIPLSAAGEGTVVLDFDAAFLGNPELDLEAPAGTVIDVANDELTRADGMVRVYQSHFLVNAVDRIIWPGGRHRFELFHEKGGRLLQLTVRAPQGGARVHLHRAAIRQTTDDADFRGSFRCADPLFNWLWLTGVRTLRACLHDAYLDCPWREQGSYMGDAYVQYQVHRVLAPQPAQVRRALGLYAQGQREDGHVPCVVPAWYTDPHSDFTMIWPIAIERYWADSGDTAFVRQIWPNIERVWSSPRWLPGVDGLWDVGSRANPQTDARMFIDWGVDPADTTAATNGVLNALRIGALKACSRLAATIGLPERAQALAREAEALAVAYHKHLWIEAEGRYAGGLVDGTPVETQALHANTLALLFRIPPDGATDRRALDHLLRGLRRSWGDLDACVDHGGHLELYFLHYALEVLADRGELEAAEEVVRRFWGQHQNKNANTFWEAFTAGREGGGSQCHAWSCGPLLHFSRRLLGVRLTQAGDPDTLIVEPEAAGLDWAEGVFPHVRGDVRVRWHRADGACFLHVEYPKALKLQARPGRGLDHLRAQIKLVAY